MTAPTPSSKSVSPTPDDAQIARVGLELLAKAPLGWSTAEWSTFSNAVLRLADDTLAKPESVSPTQGAGWRPLVANLGELLRKSDYEVRDVEITVARRLVERFHYAAGASNTATYLHGLFRRGEESCLGVAWWIPPTRSSAEATYPQNWQGVLALSRLAIDPSVPKNACSFLLARSRRAIPAHRWPALVTYADDWRGHTGAIYLADNWTYIGMTKPEAVFTINGVMRARKAGGHTRTRGEMAALGAVNEGSFAKHKFVMIRSARKLKTVLQKP